MPLLQIAIRRLRGSSINTRNNSYIEVLFEKSISMSELHQED